MFAYVSQYGTIYTIVKHKKHFKRVLFSVRRQSAGWRQVFFTFCNGANNPNYKTLYIYILKEIVKNLQ